MWNSENNLAEIEALLIDKITIWQFYYDDVLVWKKNSIFKGESKQN